mgnify:CR=1 FL=1
MGSCSIDDIQFKINWLKKLQNQYKTSFEQKNTFDGLVEVYQNSSFSNV